jgi:hypothetical protein
MSTAGDRKRRAVGVVEVSADHDTALGRCSRMDGLTNTTFGGCAHEGTFLHVSFYSWAGIRPKRCSYPSPRVSNGSRFRPRVSAVNLLPISLTHEALLRLNPGVVFC